MLLFGGGGGGGEVGGRAPILVGESVKKGSGDDVDVVEDVVDVVLDGHSPVLYEMTPEHCAKQGLLNVTPFPHTRDS